MDIVGKQNTTGVVIDPDWLGAEPPYDLDYWRGYFRVVDNCYHDSGKTWIVSKRMFAHMTVRGLVFLWNKVVIPEIRNREIERAD